ncbi:MAG: DUF6777 domain-containing protein, partial [Mycobacterium sp.]
QPQPGTDLATQELSGDRDGLYGGTLDNAECDRDKMIAFLTAHPPQASAFVDALNTDATLFWSGGRPLTVADIPTYLSELTPTVLRLDTRVTNHGFDGTHPTSVQSVFQPGTAVFVDAHGVPRSRCYCGNPLTAPVALTGDLLPVGTPWPGYNPQALAQVQPSTATIANFVLVDVVTGQPFNRPTGTIGTDDTPHDQPVAPPQGTPTAEQSSEPTIDGTYVRHTVEWICNGHTASPPDVPIAVTQQGNTVTIVGDFTTELNGDSFEYTDQYGNITRGVFSTEGGQTVIHGEDVFPNPVGGRCEHIWIATKQ